MSDLKEQEIIFGSNEFINNTGFITKVNKVKEGYEIIMSLYLDNSIDPDHFIIITSGQWNEFMKLHNIKWIAKDGVHCYLAFKRGREMSNYDDTIGVNKNQNMKFDPCVDSCEGCGGFLNEDEKEQDWCDNCLDSYTLHGYWGSVELGIKI